MMRPTLIQRVARKLDKTLASLFFVDQWVIMTARGMDYASLRWPALTLRSAQVAFLWVLRRGRAA